MEVSVRLSSKYQVVVPKVVRKKLGLVSGDQLVVTAEDGKVIMRPKPRSYTNQTLGFGKEVWENTDVDNSWEFRN